MMSQAKINGNLITIILAAALALSPSFSFGAIQDLDGIGVPVYPGAKVYTSKEASTMNANGVDYETLPTIILATDASQEEVTAFYKEKLTTWKHKNAFGMFDVFWQEGDDFDVRDITKAGTTPNVMVMEALQPVKDEISGAKVQIQIVYKPNK